VNVATLREIRQRVPLDAHLAKRGPAGPNEAQTDTPRRDRGDGSAGRRTIVAVPADVRPGMAIVTSALIGSRSFLVTLLQLIVVVCLLAVLIVFVRVLIQLRVDQRRKERLAATRDICSLSPSEFEAYVGVLFEKAGYRVKQTGGRGDRGIDLVVSRNGRSRVVQCKRYGEDVGPGAVREFIGAMTNAQATHGFLVATSGFTTGARREAHEAPYDIGLLDGRAIVDWAARYGLPAEVMDGR